MQKKFDAKIKPSYIHLRSIYVGAGAMEHLTPGVTTVLIEGDDSFSLEGRLNGLGLLSGMAKLYQELPLERGSKIQFSIPEDGTILIHSPRACSRVEAPGMPSDESPRTQTVFERKKLRHVHIEPFRPENLKNWAPENETDVYLAFGVLQEYTDFQYCCAASAAVLRRLGAEYTETSKPDAVLIDRRTEQYVMAEWKKNSSAFVSDRNHEPDDVDVLVCWHDDVPDKTTLPSEVVVLEDVAKVAADFDLEDGDAA